MPGGHTEHTLEGDIERMTAADAAALHRETRTAPQHVGGLMVLEPGDSGFDYDRLIRLVQERISLAPRYRQKIRRVPGHLADPVWVDDPAFDLAYHVRRSALPRPGGDRQLLEFCSRVLARPLDRSRPLWEMYLVEGLDGGGPAGRIAIVTKTHPAMIDERLGADGADLAQVILDASPSPRRTVAVAWHPQPEPGPLRLVGGALAALARNPFSFVGTARAMTRDVVVDVGREVGREATRANRLAVGAASVVGAGAVVAAAFSATRLALDTVRRLPAGPLHTHQGEQRRLAIARTRLDQYRLVREAFGVSVNETVLAVVAGAVRGWLAERDEPPPGRSVVRALVPVGVQLADAAAAPAVASVSVRPLLVDLPVGAADPVQRLELVRAAMADHRDSGRAVDAVTLVALGGFASPTLHALGARAASEVAGRLCDLVVTNVPGAQVPMYAAGTPMCEMFPVLPLLPGQAMSLALTSYDGGVYFGINADRDAVRDVSVVAALIEASLDELVAAARATTADRARTTARRVSGDRGDRGGRSHR